MADTPPINITIDEKALEESIVRVITNVRNEFGQALFRALWDIAPGFMEENHKFIYEDGYADGVKGENK